MRTHTHACTHTLNTSSTLH